MGDVEIEAAARYLNKTIIVEHNGVKHTFGNGIEVVEIDLIDGHFPNSSDGTLTLTNNCLYEKLNDKTHISSSVTCEEFRNGIANTIVNDSEVRQFVVDPRRNFFHDIGFYGGRKTVQQPIGVQQQVQGRVDVDPKSPSYLPFMDEKNQLLIKNQLIKIDKNLDIREKDSQGKPLGLDDTTYNKKRVEGIHTAIEKVNEVLKAINPALEVKLEDFQTKNYV